MNNLEDLGIQRVVMWLVNSWPETQGEKVSLCLHNKRGRLAAFLHEKVKVLELDRMVPGIPGLRMPFRIFAYALVLRREKPDVIVAANQFESLALTFLRRFLNFRLIVCEHCHVTSNLNMADAHRGWFGRYYRRRFASEYRRYADLVHTVAHDAADDLVKNHGIPAEKLRVIYNPIDFKVLRERASVACEEPWLQPGNNTVVAASRLTGQKRLDILLRAWPEVLQACGSMEPLPKLVICGEGPMREELKGLAAELGIADSVRFVGFQDNPWKYMARARVFVSTSEWEGLPCSLIEAMSLGCPIVASDCPSGPREILLDGRAGRLFPNHDVAACSRALSDALLDSSDTGSRSVVAAENLSRFDIGEIISRYRAICHEAISLPNNSCR